MKNHTTPQQPKGTVLLVAFYNVKALGVRYLEGALERAGYRVELVFLKRFNSHTPSPLSYQELALLVQEIRRTRPLLVGLSVMSSMYLDTVKAVLRFLSEEVRTPLVCGGAFASLFPALLLDLGAHYVIRGDGEFPLVRLADCLAAGASPEGLSSLCFRRKAEVVCNPIAPPLLEIDGYGIPVVKSPHACLIDQGQLRRGDPQRNTLRYEVIASRGCPFQCSYCSCAPLHRLQPKGVPAVRTRSVNSVMEELRQARAACPRMLMVHFYDEIFPNLPGWVEEFSAAYRRDIRLPFAIWAHPKTAKASVLKELRAAGLAEVIMGIQSGSDRVRQTVFHRRESQADILAAAESFCQAGIPWVSYDFMLQHPFERLEDLKETYFLVKKLPGRYILQLHGLNFLPGTDIVPMAIEQGFYTQEEMDEILFAPMDAQFSAYWKQSPSLESQLWYHLISLWQWPSLRPLCLRCEENPLRFQQEIARACQKARRLEHQRSLRKKLDLALRRLHLLHEKAALADP